MVGSVNYDGNFWLRIRICLLSWVVIVDFGVSCFRGLGVIGVKLKEFLGRIWGNGDRLE